MVRVTVEPADAVEATDEATEAHAAAEGVNATETSGTGSSSTLRDMLMSTDPDESLEHVESPWDPEVGGIDRVYRGVRKMAGVDGLPAIADLTIGVAEFVVGRDLGGGGDEGGGGEDTGNEPTPAEPTPGGSE